MPKLNQRGVAHLLLPLILLAGLIATVYLVTSGNPLKLFSKASNAPIVFKSLDGKVLPLNKDGIPQIPSTSPNVMVELTSTLGSPPSVSSPVSGPNSRVTVAYRAGFSPTDLDRITFSPYVKEPTVYNVGFDKKGGIQFYWVEFKAADGRLDRRSAQIEIVSSSSACKEGVNQFTIMDYCRTVNNVASFKYAGYTCYDGVSGRVGDGSCQTQQVLQDLTNKACQGHSSCTIPSPTPGPISAPLGSGKATSSKTIQPASEPTLKGFMSVFGSRKGDKRYNPAYDANNDGQINIADFSLLRTRFK